MTGVKGKNGLPIRKPWRFITSSATQAEELSQFVCNHSKDRHTPAVGSDTKPTEVYPPKLCRTLIRSLFRDKWCVPSMPTVPVKQHEHRERTHMHGFVMSPFSLEQGFHHAAEEHLRGKHDQPRVEPPP
eukprot:3923654-Karenia_brevis.AAC.1